MTADRIKTRWFAALTLVFLAAVNTPAVRGETDPSTPHIIVATGHAPPFAIRTPEGWQGITIELIRHLAHANGFTYRFQEMGLEAMLQAAADGEVSVAAAAVTATAERERRLDFTHPFYTTGLGVALPQRNEMTWISALKRIASPAFLHSVGALLAILTLVGVLVWLVERRRNHQFPGDPLKGVGSGIWWSAVTMTTVGYGDKAPVTPTGRLLGLIWMFSSIVIISGFTAAIATSLTVGELDQSITGVDDLYGKRVLTRTGSTSAAYLDAQLIRYQTLDSVAEALDRLAEGRADAVVYDIPILRYLVRDKRLQNVRVLPNIFERQDYAIALPPGAPIREQLNREILRITRSPEWTRMVEEYLGPQR